MGYYTVKNPEIKHPCKNLKCRKMIPHFKKHCSLKCYYDHLRSDPTISAKYTVGIHKRKGNVRTLETCKCLMCGKKSTQRMFIQEVDRGKVQYINCKECANEGEYADVWGWK